MKLRYRITTLGCRVNHAETRELESVLLSRGLAAAVPGEPADVEVVHTCTVTATAAAKSRQAVRRAGRRGEPLVVVTGCWPSTDPDRASRLGGLVLHHGSKRDDRAPMVQRFARRLDRWLGAHHRTRWVRSPERSCSLGPDGILPLPVVAPRPGAGGHVRAELKIQDGCDAHCTFCIIPRTRPELRSKRIPDAVAEARRLVALGHREIVLTGIFIGAYGHATALRRRQAPRDPSPLADLVDAVAAVPGLDRLRISSLEPGDVTPGLLDAMVANTPVVVPHLHLPLQSGSDAVLRRMNRQYQVGEYLEMIDAVRAALTDPTGLPPAVTTDVICGFPGETVRDFDQTVDVARRACFLHMHVFPYSPRAGTAAARWTDRFVPAEEVRRRVHTLIDLEQDPARGLAIAFHRRLEGRRVRVMLEQPVRDAPGVMTGRCDHYAAVDLRTDLPRGTLVEARVTEVTPQRLTGTLVETPVRVPLTVVPRRSSVRPS